MLRCPAMPATILIVANEKDDCDCERMAINQLLPISEKLSALTKVRKSRYKTIPIVTAAVC